MKHGSTSPLGPVGVAGCGRMGAPMARALIRAGFDVAGLDILPPQSFGDLAPCMTDAAAFAAGRRIVLSVVRDVAETEQLLFDDQALIARRPSAIDTLLICSTLSPRYITDLRARVPVAIALVDAPMSGASISAEEARLSFMLGGAPEDLARLQPLFETLAQPVRSDLSGQPLAEDIGSLGLTGAMRLDLTRLGASAKTLVPPRTNGKGLSRGATLAALLSTCGLAFQPRRTPAGRLELRIVKPATGTTSWPVGWAPRLSRIKTARPLFKIVPVELN